MKTPEDKVLERIEKLEKMFPILQKENEDLKKENQLRKDREAYLKDQVALLTAQLYGKKSEKKLSGLPVDQLNFFDSVSGEEESITMEGVLPSTLVKTYKRKKPGRKALPDTLPRKEVTIDIGEEEKFCDCGENLTRIGEEIAERLNYIPAKLEVIREIRPKYACKSCEGENSQGKSIKVAPAPKRIIPGSIATAALLSHIITGKFVDALPFYRQEKQFARLGYELSRTNMINWTIQLGEKIKPLLKILKSELLSGPLVHIDETTVQVLKEEGRSPSTKSYMWVLRSGASKNQGVFFEYSPSRSASTPKRLLKGYEGTVMTDGYAGYNFITQPKFAKTMKRAGCWAHARRKFAEVIKARGKDGKCGHADEAMQFIGKLYGIEKEGESLKLSKEANFYFRQVNATPALNQFLGWLKDLEHKVVPKSLLGQAVHYTLSQWKHLSLYVEIGDVPLDNNPAENAIRPFVIGRKNWLFCDTARGAESMAGLYSLIETARSNKLNPTHYLKQLFEKLPYVESDKDLKTLLPFSKIVSV